MPHHPADGHARRRHVYCQVSAGALNPASNRMFRGSPQADEATHSPRGVERQSHAHTPTILEPGVVGQTVSHCVNQPDGIKQDMKREIQHFCRTVSDVRDRWSLRETKQQTPACWRCDSGVEAIDSSSGHFYKQVLKYLTQRIPVPDQTENSCSWSEEKSTQSCSKCSDVG